MPVVYPSEPGAKPHSTLIVAADASDGTLRQASMNERIALYVYESFSIQNAKAFECPDPQIPVAVCLQGPHKIGIQASGGVGVVVYFDASIRKVYAMQAIAFGGDPYFTIMIQEALNGTVALERGYAFNFLGSGRVTEQTIRLCTDPDIVVVPVKDSCSECFRLAGGADISQFHVLLLKILRLPPVATMNLPLLSSAIPVTVFPPVEKFLNESLSLS